MKTATRSSGSDASKPHIGGGSGHRRDWGRSGERSLSAAEGVLVALRHCSLDEAFIDIVQTAKRHSAAPLEPADALVAIAENDVTRDFNDAVIAAVDQAWGTLLGSQPGSSYSADHEQAQQPPIWCAPPAGPPTPLEANDDRANSVRR